MNLIRGAASIYLALLVVLQPVLPFIEYAAFQDYIAENLCVEREVVGSCCKGKCFLEEKVQEANNESPESKNKSSRIKIDPSVYLLFQNVNQEHKTVFMNKNSFFYSLSSYSFYGESVFHPPQKTTTFSA